MIFPPEYQLFTTSVQSLQADKSFSVPSPANLKAVERASALTTWFAHLTLFEKEKTVTFIPPASKFYYIWLEKVSGKFYWQATTSLLPAHDNGDV